MNALIRPAGWAVTLTVVVLAGFGHAQEKKQPADPKKPPTVMQRKLAHAQKVLEGIALNDFAAISANADELTLCAQEASWKVIKSARYELYSNDFIRNLEGLKKAAKNKNTDSAALAYVDMTLTCVKCHQYVREEKIGSAPDLSPLGPRTAATK
jgi:hypothetical protein